MKYFLLIISLTISLKIQGQSVNNALITYKVKVSERSLKKYNKNIKNKIRDKKVIDFWENYYDKSNYAIGVLKINDIKSSYRLEQKLNQKSIKTLNIMDVLAGGARIYFANPLKKETIMQDCDLLDKCFLVNDSFYNWEIATKIKIINGYKCYLAISESKDKKSKISAWFTNEIPINIGPMNYSGLPGLILELDDGDLSFAVKKIEINLKRKVKISKQKKGIHISYEKFTELAKNALPKKLFSNK